MNMMMMMMNLESEVAGGACGAPEMGGIITKILSLLSPHITSHPYGYG